MCTTTPEPMNATQLGFTSPDGRRWKSNLVLTESIVATIVWPALFPPAQRQQMSIFAARISTSFPFPVRSVARRRVSEIQRRAVQERTFVSPLRPEHHAQLVVHSTPQSTVEGAQKSQVAATRR